MALTIRAALALAAASLVPGAARADRFPVVNVTVGIGAKVQPEIDGFVEPAIELGMRTRKIQGTASVGGDFSFDESGHFQGDFAWSASILAHIYELPPEFQSDGQFTWRNERAVYLRGGARMTGLVDRAGPWLGIGLSKGCVFGELGYVLSFDGDRHDHQVLALVGVSANPFCYRAPNE